MKIHVLPDTVINQIAAGEVIDRPASVVRELVDNAVDAGATRILLEIEGGGSSLIKITDNGSGMSRDDAILALERHATSKITVLADLHVIDTKGFRGEALSSIASVAKVTLRTRLAQEELGTEIQINGGVIRGVQSVACLPGTTFEIRHLFFNTPARKKFLRGEKTEEARILSWIRRSMVSHPQVECRVSINGKEKLFLPVHPSSTARASSLMPPGTTIPFHAIHKEHTISGVLAPPAFASSEMDGLCLFVNHRLVSDRILFRAVREGFHGTLKASEVPVGYVFIELPPSTVDINVHPQKSEIRFLDPQPLFRQVVATIHDALSHVRAPAVTAQVFVSSPLYQSNFHLHAEKRSEEQFQISEVRENSPTFTPFHSFEAPPSNSSSFGKEFYAAPTNPLPCPEETLSVQQEDRPPSTSYRSLKYIGQMLQCYLILEGQDGIVVIDMHAAHERIQYNRIRGEMRSGNIVSQELLFPIHISVLLPDEYLQDAIHQLITYGFHLTWNREESTIHVTAGPAYIRLEEVQSLLEGMLSPSPFDEVWSLGLFEDRLVQRIARLACHASVRSGDTLRREEVYALLTSLDEAILGGACPHGRPVAVQFPERQIEAWFGRDR